MINRVDYLIFISKKAISFGVNPGVIISKLFIEVHW